MIRAAQLANRLANILIARGKSADFMRDVLCVDDGDGLAPRLAFWDEVKLGATPTQAEVDAASELIVSIPDNGAALEVARKDDVREQLSRAIDSLSEEQQAPFRLLLQLL